MLLSLLVFTDTADGITLLGWGLLEVGETTLVGCCCDLMSGRLLLEDVEEAAASVGLLAATPPSEEVELRLSETLALEDMGDAAPFTAVEGAPLSGAPPIAVVGATPFSTAAFTPRGRLLSATTLSSFNRT